MSEIEHAYRTLQLEPDATPEDVVRARDRLIAQWDPDGLPQYSGLREKAESKITEIQAAFDTLINYLGASPAQTPQGATGSGNGADSTAEIPSGDEESSASLFDEMFSSQLDPKRRRFPILPLVFGLVTVLLILFYTMQPGPTRPGEVETRPTQSETPPASEGRPANSETQPTSLPPTPISTRVISDEIPLHSAAVKVHPKPPVPKPAQSERPPRRPTPAHKTAAPPKQKDPTATAASPPPPHNLPLAVKPQPSPVATPQSSTAVPPKKEPEGNSGPVRQEPEEQPQPDLENAFLSLLENSEKARKLTTGEVSGYRFLEWKLVQQKGSETWIDLLASDPQGRTVHFIWSVKVEDSLIVPLSQAARNLERGGEGR